MARVSKAADESRCETSRLAKRVTHCATSGEDCITQPLASSASWKPRFSSM